MDRSHLEKIYYTLIIASMNTIERYEMETYQKPDGHIENKLDRSGNAGRDRAKSPADKCE